MPESSTLDTPRMIKNAAVDPIVFFDLYRDVTDMKMMM